MNKPIIWILILVVIGVQPVHAQTTTLKTNIDDNTLLWEISGNGLAKPSFVFGTFHLVCRDDIHFSPSFKKAIAGTDEIYLELDLDDPATMLGALTLINMKGDKKIKDLYSPENYKKVVAFFKDSLKISISLFQHMKPGFLAALLYPGFLGCKNTMSTEEAIMGLASSNNKAVKGLETMAVQAAIFDSIPYEKQAAELLNAIDSLETSKRNFQLLLASYKNQQMNEIEKMMSPEFGIELSQDILLDDRNKNWVSQLKSIMKKKAVFVAVGAGHLVGKKGLIALLRAEGYTVRGLENK